MGKQVKKSLTLVICLVMMVASVPLSGFIGLELPDWSLDFSGMFDITASAASDDSGSCGTSVYYTFDSASGTLTISGSGDITSYIHYSYTPWYSYRTSIIFVVIESGVNSIGDYVFYNCTNLTSITIPDSVTSIGMGTFFYCTSLTSITISNSVTSIEMGAFYYCANLETIYFYGTPEEYAAISVGSDNEYFTSANVIYIYDEENIDSTDNCSCACHSTGFIKFIFDFLTFFRQIFGMTQYQVCGCGVYHW